MQIFSLMSISSNSFWRNQSESRMFNWHFVCLKAEKFILNSDCTIILPIMRVKITVENKDWIFQKTLDQYFLLKIVLMLHIISSLADIVHSSVNRWHPEQHTHSNKEAHSNKQVAKICRYYIKFCSCKDHLKLIYHKSQSMINLGQSRMNW